MAQPPLENFAHTPTIANGQFVYDTGCVSLRYNSSFCLCFKLGFHHNLKLPRY